MGSHCCDVNSEDPGCFTIAQTSERKLRPNRVFKSLSSELKVRTSETLSILKAEWFWVDFKKTNRIEKVLYCDIYLYQDMKWPVSRSRISSISHSPTAQRLQQCFAWTLLSPVISSQSYWVYFLLQDKQKIYYTFLEIVCKHGQTLHNQMMYVLICINTTTDLNIGLARWKCLDILK